MQIAAVDAIPIRRSLETPFSNAQKTIEAREYCLVRVRTADGTVGWGECWGPIAGNRDIIESVIAPRVVGKAVSDIHTIYDDLRFDLRAAYHSYLPISAISGLDIALWDCRGKQLDDPVAALLGGSRRDAVSAYATGHFWPVVDDLQEITDAVTTEAERHVAAGFDTLKQKIGLHRHPDYSMDWTADVELVTAVRDAVGPDIDLAVDANHAYDRATAERVGHQLEPHDLLFFEEPIPPAHVDEYRRLNGALDIPLAGGECWADDRDFETVIASGGVDYAQPDVTSVGGLTGGRAVARLAHRHNVHCYPHVFGSAVAIAASLQFIATLPGHPMLEYDRTPNPLRDELAVDGFERQGSRVTIPDRPGIGVDIDSDVLERFRVD